MKPYPAYKPSGVDWIGEIPEHWNVTRLKFTDEVIMGQSPSSDDYDLDGRGVPFLQGNAEFGALHPEPKYWCQTANKTANKGDILFSVRAPIGAVNIADQTYGIGRGLCAIRARQNIGRFLYYYALCSSVELNSIGTGSTYTAVSVDDIGNLFLTFPSLPEQHAIARYLDDKTKKIDTLIEKKQRLIELLKEQRTAVINQAVTKGINPNVRMKDSGIEWLGEIPEHWEVKRLKNVIRGNLTNGLFKKREDFGSGTRLVNVINVYKEDCYVDESELGRVEATPNEVDNYRVNIGDIFFVRSSLKMEGIAASASIRDVEEPTVFECHLIRIRPNSETINFRYLISYLNSSLVREKLISESYTTTMTTISQPSLSSLEMIIPPMEEQDKIVAHIENAFARFVQAESKAEKEIELLQEYRTALISEVVTGKIDVREWSQYKDAEEELLLMAVDDSTRRAEKNVAYKSK